MDITNEAVEAAARAFHHGWNPDGPEPFHSLGLARVRSALEAAAPYLMAEAWNEGYKDGRDGEWEDANPYQGAHPHLAKEAKTTILRMNDPNAKWEEL